MRPISSTMIALAAAGALSACASGGGRASTSGTAAAPGGRPEDTEVWQPVPKVVTPGAVVSLAPPSDAIVLFDGRNLDEWVSVGQNGPSGPARWKVEDGIMTVDKKTGNIETKRRFTNYQLHLEWRTPSNISGRGQGRANSGLFLASTGGGDAGYEIQILDSYRNETYVNGMVGSIYKQNPPLVNASRGPGEWQTYDIVWTAPTFNPDGTLRTAARVTAIHNGVLVQNDFALRGQTVYIGQPKYTPHGPSPIKLQSHGDPSEPISFRNIWIREL